jgi:hypothetical protein
MKGIFEFEVFEKKRGFKFGTYGISVACEKEGCSIDELYKKCGIPYNGKNGLVKSDKPNIKALLHLFFGAAVHYTEHKKQEVDFSVSDVADWLDEIGLEKINQIIVDGLNQYVPKNSNSLAETGEKVTQ